MFNLEENESLMVGYGTFVTEFDLSREGYICKVMDYKRVYDKNSQYWYPFAVKAKGKSFLAIVFKIKDSEIPGRDGYECVYSGLYIRKRINVMVKDGNGDFNKKMNAWIYLPGIKTILFAEALKDEDDSWIEKIRGREYLKERFPEFWENRFISSERIEELSNRPNAKIDPNWIPAIKEETCPTCGKKVEGFRNEISKKEYGISGMCQKCQDSVFGVD